MSTPVKVLPDAKRVIVPAFAATVMPSLSRLSNVLLVTVAVIAGVVPPVNVSSFSPSSPLPARRLAVRVNSELSAVRLSVPVAFEM